MLSHSLVHTLRYVLMTLRDPISILSVILSTKDVVFSLRNPDLKAFRCSRSMISDTHS
jgi:hypothetical protein